MKEFKLPLSAFHFFQQPVILFPLRIMHYVPHPVKRFGEGRKRFYQVAGIKMMYAVNNIAVKDACFTGIVLQKTGEFFGLGIFYS